MEGSREDRTPRLWLCQLLRIFCEVAEELGDGFERAADCLGLGVGAGDANCRLSRVSRSRSDGGQEQRTAGDGLAMQVGVGQANKDVSPIINQRVQAGRQPASR